MKKIKNKIIKMLGGITPEEKEIAILKSKKDVCLSINVIKLLFVFKFILKL